MCVISSVGILAEDLHLEPVEAAAAGRGEIHLARARLDVLDQLFGVVGREFRVGDQDAGRVGDDGDGMKSFSGLTVRSANMLGLIEIVPTLPRKIV